jgi:hypothetical protein
LSRRREEARERTLDYGGFIVSVGGTLWMGVDEGEAEYPAVPVVGAGKRQRHDG